MPWDALPHLDADRLESLFEPPLVAPFEAVLREHLSSRRWFGGKAREIADVRISVAARLSLAADTAAHVALVRVSYNTGPEEVYQLPLMEIANPPTDASTAFPAELAVARLRHGLVIDAVADPRFGTALARLILAHADRDTTTASARHELMPIRVIRGIDGAALPDPTLSRAEQTNSSLVFGTQVILKLYRKLELGIQPDVEMGRHLTEAGFAATPAVVGYLEYAPANSLPATLAVIDQFIPNLGDAWPLAVANAQSYLSAGDPGPLGPAPMLEAFKTKVGILAQRTAELHLALARPTDDPAFAPEPLTLDAQHDLLREIQERCAIVLGQLAKRPADQFPAVQSLRERWPILERRLVARLSKPIQAQCTRIHGDYHLGQVLYTGADFVIIDFEGEPSRPLAERRRKQSPLKDVAGMLRSFHYAASTACIQHGSMMVCDSGMSELERARALEHRAAAWYATVSQVFWQTYQTAAASGGFLPVDAEDRLTLLNAFLVDKAWYEIDYELGHRPDWLGIPIRGLLQLLDEATP